MAPPVDNVTYGQPEYAQPVNVLAAPAVYPGYYARPYYPPIGVELDFGYGGGYRDHRHWR
jgi:hypothetical protein